MQENDQFRGLDKDADLYISERNLPHWFQPGSATFVTFRTVDSMPRVALDLWEKQLRQFLTHNRIDSSISLSEAVERMSDSIRRKFENFRAASYHKILDKGYGACVLRNPQLSAIVASALKFYDGTCYDLDRFVVMPNHVHLLAAFRQEYDMRHTLEKCMHYSALKINQVLNASGAFWQGEPFDHCVRNEYQFLWLQRYIRDNPKKARLCRNNYHYWQRSE